MNSKWVSTGVMFAIGMLIAAGATAYFVVSLNTQQSKSEEPRAVKTTGVSSCQSSEDCIIVTNICGAVQSINKNYKQEWDAEVAEKVVVQCAPTTEVTSDFIAACVTNKCVAKKTASDHFCYSAETCRLIEYTCPDGWGLYTNNTTECSCGCASEDFLKSTTPKTTEWQTYHNGEYGFEIKYPTDWLVKDETGVLYGEGWVRVILSSPDQSLKVSIDHKGVYDDGVYSNVTGEERALIDQILSTFKFIN